jgi:adenosylmethionine-8-amino-7-oxononanoate aminotransferase
MSFETSGPSEIAAAIVEEMVKPAANAAVNAGGAARAAREIATLI